MAKIFISYARPTLERARLIAETLRASGHEVWLDDQLLAHRSFSDAIAEQLAGADVVLVVWSADATRSEWVRSEASRGRQTGKLVQVRLERCQLPMPFDQIHCVDLSSWHGDYEVPAWRSVLASIAALTRVKGGDPVATSGAAVPATGPRSERRQVTALVCGLTNFGALATQLDPEDMIHVLDVFLAARDDIIAHFGGVIAESGGQRALAYFGYPRADEEEAANAVRAGLSLCESVSKLDLPMGVRLQTRVGIATGLVVIADLARGGGHAAGVVGETPTLAAKLESIAAPDGVVVSEATRLITDGLFTCRDLGPTALPGYEASLRAFAVLGATEIATRSQARTRGRTTPLFGRAAESALLDQCWASAVAGEGQVVLIQGEAGIGKSRLVETFRQGLDGSPAVPITWSCAPNYSDSALHPVSEQLAAAAGFERHDDAAVRREKLQQLLARYGEDASAGYSVLANVAGVPVGSDDALASLTPEKRKSVTLNTLLSLLSQLAAEQPVLLIVEDLHWADPTTLELLDRATRRAADQRWLILGTARPEFEEPWSAHADVVHIQLGKLNRADASRICASLGAEGVLAAEMVREIISRSDGNPLFVEEMTRSVLDAVAHGPAAGASNVAIPNTLQDSLAARLDRLGSAKAVANLCAVIGRSFSYELLASVAPQPASELRVALRELARSGLLERSGIPPNSHYLFKHALIRDAAYESLLKREREGLHGRIAKAIVDRFPETLEAEPALVAYHLTQSGAIADAVPLWAQAGRRAGAQAAHAEAASHLRTALELVRRLPDDGARAGLELEFLLGRAANLSACRGYSAPEVGAALAEARAICDRLGNAAGLFAVLRAICSFRIVESNVVAAEEAALRCQEIGEQTASLEHRIEADDGLGSLLLLKGEFAASRMYLERAATTYREYDGPSRSFWTVPGPLTICLGYIPTINYVTGELAAAERAAASMISHLASLKQNYDLAYGSAWHSIYYLVSENYAAALTFASRALEVSEDNGYDTFAAIALSAKGSAMGRQGSLTEALDMATRGCDALARLGVRFTYAFFLCQLADLQAAAGSVADALSTVDRAIAHALEFGDRFYLSPAYCRRAELLGRTPSADPAMARAALRDAVSVAEAQGAAVFAARAKSMLIKAAA